MVLKISNYCQKENALWVNDVWINNDALNEHLDISGERVELQMNQFTSGILDVLKAGLGFNLNVHTFKCSSCYIIWCYY